MTEGNPKFLQLGVQIPGDTPAVRSELPQSQAKQNSQHRDTMVFQMQDAHEYNYFEKLLHEESLRPD